ncbi:MAG TPA: multiheme c-type cytochrome, partial [Sulfurovum sp.]|nr:multiheme c-type cytochrome [Sulfurovum sp.]
MVGKKAAYFLIVLSGLMFIGCGGGSSTSDGTMIPDDNTTFPDVVLHDPSFTTTHFSGSQNCAQCHDGIKDANGTDVSIVKAWQGTMMANSATDPLWKAKVATEVKEHPEFKQTIEAKCSRCHTPMATVEATFDDPSGDTVKLSGDGFLNHNNYYYDAAMQGVSCTLCHQIENTPELGTTDGFSGKFVIADKTGIDRKIYGPYTNPKTPPMQNSVQFTPEYSPHINESKLCATCHNLETPVIATDGSLTDFTFPEQAAYTEWEYSDFNGTQSCQDCHMPKAEGSVIISTRGNNLEQRTPFYQHKFLGANTYMLEILRNNRVKLGILADETRFNESIIDTREFLKASADVNITQWSFENGLLNFDVLLTNHSGHKFPTGFPSRRAWLHIIVKNSASQIVFESGAINNEGQIIGVDDTLAANEYEPHHDKIDNDKDVQIYETILSDTDDNMTYILLHALHYLKDNRILPRGLDKNDVNLPETINPHGNAENDSNFIGGSD